MPKKILLAILILISVHEIVIGQELNIRGKVISSNEKHESLPFVKITLLRTKANVISDIDGKWSIAQVTKNDTLLFNYMGYETKRFPVAHFDLNIKEQIIYLSEKPAQLSEVTIKPEKNPAERIIKEVIAHKKENNYANIKCYAYYAYTNMHANASTMDSASQLFKDLPALNRKPMSSDSAKHNRFDKTIDSFSEKQYPFLIETIESVGYRSPGRIKKELLAYRVSGIDDARIAIFTEAFQSFNIYDNYIELREKNYVSPIAATAINNYLFIIEDTIWSPEKDTIFVISYQPRSHKTFNGFKGTIYISSKNYAVQDIIANPQKGGDGLALQLRQQFEFVNNKHWFPVREEVKIDFGKLAEGDNHVGVFEGSSSYEQINFDTLIPSKDFTDVETTVAVDAGKKDSLFWNKYRGRSQSQKESTTYRIIDSIGKKIKFDKIMSFIDIIQTQRIPIGKFDLDLTKIMAYNSYEKYRLGMGIYTNDKVSRYFSIGGYYGYGFGDHRSKYGGSLDIKPVPNSFFSFGASYSNDVYEFGGTRFALESFVPYSDQIRYLGINDMYTSTNKSGYLRFSLPIHVQIQGSLSQNLVHTNDNYNYMSHDHIPGSNYNFTEAQLGIRYAYKETIMKMPGSQMTMPYSKGPVVYFQYSHGLKNIGGDYSYDKLDLKINKKFILSTIGYANVQVSSGSIINRAVPLFKEYNAPAKYWMDYPLASENSFETMRINEFFDSRFLYVFYKQTLAWHPYKNEYSAPTFSFREDIGFGQLDNAALNSGLSIKTMNKGYYESGFQVDNVLISKYYGFGIGFFYRYGPYSLEGFKNNFAFKVTLSSPFLQ